jgi:hypothetical protein
MSEKEPWLFCADWMFEQFAETLRQSEPLKAKCEADGITPETVITALREMREEVRKLNATATETIQ